MRDFFREHDPVFFVSHIDGDCINNKEGKLQGEALYVTATVKASDNAEITINGQPAVYDPIEHTYSAQIPLYNYRNTLYAIDSKNGYRAEIVVFWLKNAVDKFYFTVDDCIVFLYELSKHPEKYPSLFDHPFLAIFKKAHRLYGAHVHLNLYYEFDAASMADFAAHKEYFNLSMMTDRYRGEWEENADWLTLSFHANANYPDMPNKCLDSAFIAASMRKTHKEICRFAGRRSLVPVTTAHWGNGYIEPLRAFREGGYLIQCGSFRQMNNDEAYLSYFGRDGIPAYLRGVGLDSYNRPSDAKEGFSGRDVWKDTREDIYYCHPDMVLNYDKGIPTEQIEGWLDQYMALRPNSGIMGLMIHEEYFYPDYTLYIRDFGERVLKAIAHIYAKGYRSCPLEALILEPLGEDRI